MGAYVNANNAYSTLLAGITNVATSVSIQVGHGSRFPTVNNGGSGTDWTWLTLQDASNNIEIVKCTRHDTGSTTFTIDRSQQEGTTARAWSAGDIIEIRPTAATVVTVDGTQTLSNKTLATLSVAGAAVLSTLNGMLKGVTGAVTVATAGTDYVKPDTSSTFTAKEIFQNTLKVQQLLEKITVSATAATGTVTFDFLTQAILYYTTNAAANWTLNIRGDGSNTLDSLMAVGESCTVTHMVQQGSTAYYNNALQIDGSSGGVTLKWANAAPTYGDANNINIYTYTIIKTGAATFTVLASQSRYA